MQRASAILHFDDTGANGQQLLIQVANLIQEGRGTTDSAGNFVLEVPADLAEASRA